MSAECRKCEKPITLVTTRRPDDGVELTFWAHTAALQSHGPIETHKAEKK